PGRDSFLFIRVDYAENGGVRPDAEREREHSHGGEARVLQQLADGEAKIIHIGAPPSDRLSDQSFFTWMLPPLLRRTMGFPPPLTGPLRWSRAILPLTVTDKSLVTPPPDVAASRSNAESCARCTVTPPPDVPSFTSSDNGAENRAEMEPPEVEPSTLPATFSRVMPPPLLSTRIGPRNSF